MNPMILRWFLPCALAVLAADAPGKPTTTPPRKPGTNKSIETPAANGPLDARFPAANDAVAGRVTVVGVPHVFSGNDFDWSFNATSLHPPVNNEWTWQLNRMQFWSDLAKAYAATGDERYAEAFVRQLTAWLDQTGGGLPPKEKIDRPGCLFRTIEEGLRLRGSWADAYGAFAKSPAFTPALRERFRASARAQAKHILDGHRTKPSQGNWLLIEMSGVYTFYAMFPDEPEAAASRKRAAEIFCAALREQVLPDGFHYELSPDYHHVFYMTATGIYGIAAKYGFEAELPADYRAILERGADAVAQTMTPAFTEPAFNDSYNTPASAILEPASRFFPARADFLWGATKGGRGKPPAGATASRFLPYAGYAIMRSGWKPDASYLAFDVGPAGPSGHRHQDKLGFTMWKGGEELVFDDGGGQYDNSPQRAYATSSFDHNVLIVDGQGQNRSEPKTVEAPIDAGWSSTAKADHATGVYDQGYGNAKAKLATHTRRIDFDKAADTFTITDDAVSADAAPHDYKILFHVDSKSVDVAADGRSAIVRYGRRWNLRLTVPEGGTITTATGQTSPRLYGWYVGRHGTAPDYHPATTIIVSAPERTLSHRFVTVLKAVEAK